MVVNSLSNLGLRQLYKYYILILFLFGEYNGGEVAHSQRFISLLFVRHSIGYLFRLPHSVLNCSSLSFLENFRLKSMIGWLSAMVVDVVWAERELPGGGK